MKKRLIILGSTGSIGTKTLEVVGDFADRFEIVALSSHGQVELLEEQVARFKPKAVSVTSGEKEAAGREIAQRHGLAYHPGEHGLVDLINEFDADMVMVATVGFVGTVPTLAAIKRGMTIALANKEVLVTAGHIVMEEARQAGVDVLPVDSEHNAIFQCLQGTNITGVRRLILTASGGPFRGRTRDEMRDIKPGDALKHPTWEMGAKITIDCSTLMNKGFEVMEAAHLFDIPVEQVDVVVHPQSVIHSMVEYMDGSIISQMGVTDMYFPIQNILLYPERQPNKFPPLDFAALGQMTFFEPDKENFPCLSYAYDAARRGGTYPAVLNAANEVAVARFLAGEISYLDLPATIKEAMDAHVPAAATTIQEICDADTWAREFAAARVAGTV
jgi:1-deoxy-D-xylulose-5-phosphate reductoisomerase